VSLPGFGRFKLPGLKSLNPFGKSVRSTDVIIGALVGLVGGAFVKKGITKFWPTAPAFVTNYAGPISVLAAGAAAMIVLKNKAKATGIFAGAATVALVPMAYGLIAAQFPSLAGYVSYPNALGYPIDVPRMGLLVDEGQRRLSGLAAHAMNDMADEPEYQFAP
jgi:hypothetical protein